VCWGIDGVKTSARGNGRKGPEAETVVWQSITNSTALVSLYSKQVIRGGRVGLTSPCSLQAHEEQHIRWKASSFMFGTCLFLVVGKVNSGLISGKNNTVS